MTTARVVAARRVADAADRVADAAHAAAVGPRRPCGRCRSGRAPTSRRARASAAPTAASRARASPSTRRETLRLGGLRHVLRDRLGEERDAERRPGARARRPRPRSRRASPCATAAELGDWERVLHGGLSPARPRSFCDPLPGAPQAVARATSAAASRARARARETSSTLRRASPRARLAMARLRVDAGDPAQSRAARARSSRSPVPTLKMPPPARPRRAARDDVADVDEVARLLAVAEDGVASPRRQPLEEDRDDAALERGRLARPVDVGEAQDDVARAVDAVPAGEVLLGAELRDPVRRERPSRRRPRSPGASHSP